MERVELLTHLEQIFGTEVPDEVAQRIYTVRELVEAVRPKEGGATTPTRRGGDAWGKLLDASLENDADLAALLCLGMTSHLLPSASRSVPSLAGQTAAVGGAAELRGEFRFEAGVAAPRQAIQKSNTNLLMEAARRLDEWRVLSKKIPSVDLVPMLVSPGSYGIRAGDEAAVALIDDHTWTRFRRRGFARPYEVLEAVQLFFQELDFDGAEELARCAPVYEEMPGWRESTVGVKDYERLPKAARDALTAGR